MTSEMVTAVGFGIISVQETFQNPAYNRKHCVLATVGEVYASILNYDTFSTTNSSKTAENHCTENELEATAYLASKWQQPDRTSLLDYSLA